jgi:hypothetical protein
MQLVISMSETTKHTYGQVFDTLVSMETPYDAAEIAGLIRSMYDNPDDVSLETLNKAWGSLWQTVRASIESPKNRRAWILQKQKVYTALKGTKVDISTTIRNTVEEAIAACVKQAGGAKNFTGQALDDYCAARDDKIGELVEFVISTLSKLL